MAVRPPSRVDPTSPASVAGATFGTARKGYDPDEVRELLTAVSVEMSRMHKRLNELQRELDEARSAPQERPLLDEETVTTLLGEETARVLSTAREAAAQIRARAEESAAKMLKEASEESAAQRSEIELEVARRRTDAVTAAEAEIEMARQQGRDMVNEARDYRERVLADVARRRELARQQIEQLVHGRDRLINAFERARLAAVDVMSELAGLGDESDEMVNLSPTTGPVTMIPREPVAAPVDHGGQGAAPYDQRTAEKHEAERHDAATATGASAEEAPSEGDEGRTEPEPTPTRGLHLAPPVEETEDADETEAEEAEAEAEPEPADEGTPAADAAEEDAGGELVRLPAPDEDDDYDDEEYDEDDDRPSAPVVSLFAGEIDGVREAERERSRQADDTSADESAAEQLDTVAEDRGEEPAAATPANGGTEHEGKPSVDDLFAKLRRASATMVAREAAEALADGSSAQESAAEAGEEQTAPAEETIFTARDEALVPLILSAARKLKRVLADEQNDVLDALRRTSKIERLDALLPGEKEQAERYVSAIGDELSAAARAGADSLGGASPATLAAASTLAPVHEMLAAEVVRPLRERLDRAVMQVGEDSAELSTLVRNVYREWKTQRIDEHIEDVVRLAHGRGGYVSLTPGTGVCWRVDPNGPPCADAEDNSLGGIVPAGDPFPTGHTYPPMHAGCRCLLETAQG